MREYCLVEEMLVEGGAVRGVEALDERIRQPRADSPVASSSWRPAAAAISTR